MSHLDAVVLGLAASCGCFPIFAGCDGAERGAPVPQA
jgi:hypothetical protein